MVCPMCVIPLISGLSAVGTGRLANTAHNDKMKSMFWALTVVFSILCIYYLLYKYVYLKWYPRSNTCDECHL